MTLTHHPRAGRYARERYVRGLRAYRRRIRWPLFIVVVPLLAFVIGVMVSHKLDHWSLVAGAALAVAIVLAMYTLGRAAAVRAEVEARR